MSLIELTDDKLDTPIYRVMKREYVISLFADRQNVLVPPRKWDDPFENFILQSKVALGDGTAARFGFHDDFYGQCWTLHKASDAMWRIYSPDRRGVRVRTTIRKLYESLRTACGVNSHWQAHIGRVRYLNKKELLDFCVRGVSLSADGSGVAETLLVKRLAFKHELEVRLLYFADTTAKEKLFGYSVDPTVLVEQLMVDPRLTVKEARADMEALRKETGWDGEILRSLLYRPPKGFVTRIRS